MVSVDAGVSDKQFEGDCGRGGCGGNRTRGEGKIDGNQIKQLVLIELMGMVQAEKGAAEAVSGATSEGAPASAKAENDESDSAGRGWVSGGVCGCGSFCEDGGLGDIGRLTEAVAGLELNVAQVLQRVLEREGREGREVCVEELGVPSLGSLLHDVGICKPCVFANKNSKVCHNGAMCYFCHHVHKERRKRTKKHSPNTTPYILHVPPPPPPSGPPPPPTLPPRAPSPFRSSLPPNSRRPSTSSSTSAATSLCRQFRRPPMPSTPLQQPHAIPLHNPSTSQNAHTHPDTTTHPISQTFAQRSHSQTLTRQSLRQLTPTHRSSSLNHPPPPFCSTPPRRCVYPDPQLVSDGVLAIDGQAADDRVAIWGDMWGGGRREGDGGCDDGLLFGVDWLQSDSRVPLSLQEVGWGGLCGSGGGSFTGGYEAGDCVWGMKDVTRGSDNDSSVGGGRDSVNNVDIVTTPETTTATIVTATMVPATTGIGSAIAITAGSCTKEATDTSLASSESHNAGLPCVSGIESPSMTTATQAVHQQRPQCNPPAPPPGFTRQAYFSSSTSVASTAGHITQNTSHTARLGSNSVCSIPPPPPQSDSSLPPPPPPPSHNLTYTQAHNTFVHPTQQQSLTDSNPNSNRSQSPLPNPPRSPLPPGLMAPQIRLERGDGGGYQHPVVPLFDEEGCWGEPSVGCSDREALVSGCDGTVKKERGDVVGEGTGGGGDVFGVESGHVRLEVTKGSLGVRHLQEEGGGERGVLGEGKSMDGILDGVSEDVLLELQCLIEKVIRKQRMGSNGRGGEQGVMDDSGVSGEQGTSSCVNGGVMGGMGEGEGKQRLVGPPPGLGESGRVYGIEKHQGQHLRQHQQQQEQSPQQQHHQPKHSTLQSSCISTALSSPSFPPPSFTPSTHSLAYAPTIHSPTHLNSSYIPSPLSPHNFPPSPLVPPPSTCVSPLAHSSAALRPSSPLILPPSSVSCLSPPPPPTWSFTNPPTGHRPADICSTTRQLFGDGTRAGGLGGMSGGDSAGVCGGKWVGGGGGLFAGFLASPGVRREMQAVSALCVEAASILDSTESLHLPESQCFIPSSPLFSKPSPLTSCYRTNSSLHIPSSCPCSASPRVSPAPSRSSTSTWTSLHIIPPTEGTTTPQPYTHPSSPSGTPPRRCFHAATPPTPSTPSRDVFFSPVLKCLPSLASFPSFPSSPEL
eukprot:GHVQ01017220.1.p1 GENE.GHVQ01017220.1~~GHVQ01017220.1.p1  ORF type:complete len:1188 (+),score=294.77 GHVQ01017220.1:673-4236(+)